VSSVIAQPLPTSAIVASVRELVKTYGGERALDGVNLDVRAGEVHALLGPNGSGKSTLIGSLGGAVTPDGGVITVGGVETSGLTPSQARELGIAVIYQHFSLADTLTVSDNVFLGAELRRGPFVDRRAQRRRTREIVEAFDLDLDPDALVGDLRPGERQVVEIAKALLHDPRLLILDEPTTALSVAETERLLERVEALAATGLGIIFISHLLDDVLRVAHTVTVLRDGRLMQTAPIEEFDKASLVAAIAPSFSAVVIEPVARETPLLELRGAHLGGIGPIDLTLHEGEVLGLFGMLGAGRTELLEALYGVRVRGGEWSGEVLLAGEAIRTRSPAHALRQGIALVASERGTKGLFAHLSALDNVLISTFDDASRWGIRRKSNERRIFDESCSAVNLKPARPRLAGSGFSGGNQQKLLIARCLNELAGTRLLLLDEPTQGVDVGARGEIYRLVRDFARRSGCAVLVAASEVEELEELADRAIVLHRHSVAGLVERGPNFQHDLLTLAHTGRPGPAVTKAQQ